MYARLLRRLIACSRVAAASRVGNSSRCTRRQEDRRGILAVKSRPPTRGSGGVADRGASPPGGRLEPAIERATRSPWARSAPCPHAFCDVTIEVAALDQRTLHLEPHLSQIGPWFLGHPTASRSVPGGSSAPMSAERWRVSCRRAAQRRSRLTARAGWARFCDFAVSTLDFPPLCAGNRPSSPE
jgi:hypothetical protein